MAITLLQQVFENKMLLFAVKAVKEKKIPFFFFNRHYKIDSFPLWEMADKTRQRKPIRAGGL